MNKICQLHQELADYYRQLADYYQNFSFFVGMLSVVLIGYILYDLYENY